MYSKEEKILILGSLFHDVGKFVQRCANIREHHTIVGRKFFENELDIFKDKSFDFKDYLIKVLGDEDNYKEFQGIIENHHKPKTSLEKIVQTADHLSASERPDLQIEEGHENIWRHKFLCSVLSKINIKSTESVNKLYFNQLPLIKENYESLIPNLTESTSGEKYELKDLEKFRNDLRQIFSFYESEEDFSTVVNLLLTLMEKYLWCVPDFTGSDETDISLFNHSKDVCGLSLAIRKSNGDSNKLNLIIGDIPRIQDYIFDLYSAKGVAKILRGRSIFVQILSRNFASKFLNKLGLTECNLVMLAGGKFYIVAQNSNDFEQKFNEVRKEVDDFLWENFNAEMTFNSAYTGFNCDDLKDKKITFGKIVEEANKELLQNKKKLFINNLFTNGSIDEDSFVIRRNYVEPEDNDTNNIKCKLTNKPIIETQEVKLKNVGLVTKQVKSEFDIGDEIPDDNVVVVINEDGLTVKKIFPLDTFEGYKDSQKILINPDLDKILEIVKNKESGKLDFLKNTKIIEVASYVQKNTKENKSDKDQDLEDIDGKVMTFSKLAKQGEGINYLTMIKGDIDNLGLIMALGLDRDNGSLSAISRTTTMSNHLKYFFSFYLNEFLRKNHPNTYTIFAGGDDLMLIAPQNEAVILVDSLNNKFKAFACDNPEIHISYSITHFNDHTPIKLVNIFADENQDLVKKSEKVELMENSFEKDNNKSSSFIFDTKLKNSDLGKLKSNTDKLYKWVNDNKENNKTGISMSVLRNLLRLVEIMKDYRENKDTSKLYWHPMLTYMINRNLKSEGKYRDESVGKFFEEVLSLNKENKNLEKILYPAICGAIYKLRKNKN